MFSIAMRLCWKSRTPDNCFADEWVSNETLINPTYPTKTYLTLFITKIVFLCHFRERHVSVMRINVTQMMTNVRFSNSLPNNH